jgi:D-glutamate N-acetyltransferase
VSTRYLILAEGRSGDPHHGKTARGVIRYAPERVVCVLDSERPGEELGGFPIVGTVEEALQYEPDTALVGVATQGGRFPPAWRDLLKACVASGLDVENGLHEFLTDDSELVGLAAAHDVELRDLRKPPPGLNVPTGENLDVDAHVVLTVGSDCAIGKMTVSLELHLEALRRGLASQFVATGQTGIAIAGWGIAVDAVVADFIAGASEQLVLEGVKRGGELLWVEGQGALTHPQYSGVTLGLYHGSAPHALVLCHRVGDQFVNDDPRFPMPPLAELVRLHEENALIARAAKVVAVALHTGAVEDDDDARALITDVELETGLPADDPVRFGAARIVDAVLEHRG